LGYAKDAAGAEAAIGLFATSKLGLSISRGYYAMRGETYTLNAAMNEELRLGASASLSSAPVLETSLRNDWATIFAQRNGVVSLSDFNRLNGIDVAVGKFRPGEASAAAELQNFLGGQLARAPEGVSADFIITSGAHEGKTVDFMLTPDSVEQAARINENIFAKKKNIKVFTGQLTDHLLKADFVPMDTRFLNGKNINTLMDIISKQPSNLHSKIILIR